MTKAAELSIDFVTNLAQIQSELTQIKRAVGQTMGEAVASYNSLVRSADAMTASLERQAATHGKTADQIRSMDVAAKALALNEAGLTEQANRLVAAEQALIEARKKSTAANDNAAESASHYSMGQVVMQSAIRRTTDQFAAGANISTIFAEHIGTVVEVLQLYAQQSRISHAASETATEGLALVSGKAVETEEKVGGFKGALGAAAGFLAGPWGIAITAGVSVLAILGPKLFETGKAAEEAEKQLKAFEERQSDMGRFIDSTTGKLKEQARQLALIAKMQLPAEIAAQAGTTQGFVNQGFAAARGALSSTTSGDLLMRAKLNQVIQESGSNVQVLNRNLAALAKRYPELDALSDRVAGFAGQAAEAAMQIKTMQGRQTDLNTALAGGVVVSTKMIDRQVALATAHSAVAKAQQQLNDVRDRAAAIDAMDPGPAKTAAIAEYTRDLTAASKAVNAAEDAQKAYRKELSEEAKAQREAAKEARAAAAIKQQIAAGQTAAQMAEIKRAEATIEPITLKVNFADAVKSAVTAMNEIDGAEEFAAKSTAEKWAESLGRVETSAHAIADAWGTVGRSIGDAMVILASYGEQQSKLDEKLKNNKIAETDYAKQSADLQLNGLIGITDAAKNLFSEHSKGYKAMAAAEKALTIIQLARTAVDVAGGAARMFASLGPLAFPAVGAMLAVMASLGFSGGGSGGSLPASNQGKGTVLGASDTESASIKNSIEALGDIDRITMGYSAQMAASLKSIESNIGGLASLLVRTGNISGASAGIQTGFTPNALGKALGAYPAAVLGGLILGPVGAALGAVFSKAIYKIPVIGDILGGIGGVLSSLFGSKTSIVGSGLFGGSQDLASILNSGFDLQTYADIQKKKKFLGVTTGTKYSTQYGAADSQVADQFGLILKSFYDAIGAAAVPLGKSTADVEHQLDSFVVSIGKIDFTGLSGDDIQKKLEAVFGAAADQMASGAFPEILKFQQVGEGAFETLTRVASTVETVTSELTMLGLSSKSLGIDASMSIAGLFDSVDAMKSATQSYFETFYTTEEQTAIKTKQLSDAFTSLGLILPPSIAAYRALVDAQDLTTTAGQQTYAMLIQLAPAFAQISTAAQDATSAAAILRERQDLQSQLLNLQGDTAAIRAAELAKLDPSNRALKEQVYALQDQQAAAEAAAQAQQAAAQAAQEAAQKTDALRQAWQSIGDTIEDEVKRIRGLTGTGGTQSYAALLGQFNAATDAARHGDQDAAKSLPELSKEMLDAAALVATSRQELDRVQAQTAASLEQTLAMISAATAASSAATAPILGSDTSSADSANWWSHYAPAASNDTASLKDEVAGLRADMRTGLAAIAGHTKKTAKTLDDVTNGEQTVNTALVA